MILEAHSGLEPSAAQLGSPEREREVTAQLREEAILQIREPRNPEPPQTRSVRDDIGTEGTGCSIAASGFGLRASSFDGWALLTSEFRIRNSWDVGREYGSGTDVTAEMAEARR